MTAHLYGRVLEESRPQGPQPTAGAFEIYKEEMESARPDFSVLDCSDIAAEWRKCRQAEQAAWHKLWDIR